MRIDIDFNEDRWAAGDPFEGAKDLLDAPSYNVKNSNCGYVIGLGTSQGWQGSAGGADAFHPDMFFDDLGKCFQGWDSLAFDDESNNEYVFGSVELSDHDGSKSMRFVFGPDLDTDDEFWWEGVRAYELLQNGVWAVDCSGGEMCVVDYRWDVVETAVWYRGDADVIMSAIEEAGMNDPFDSLEDLRVEYKPVECFSFDVNSAGEQFDVVAHLVRLSLGLDVVNVSELI